MKREPSEKIILYGVRQVELRRDVERFLDDGYEIIGYSDTYCTCDALDGKPFLSPEKLAGTEFDYIIPLAFEESILAEITASLIDRGVPPEKIIRPTMFLHHGKEKNQADLIRDIDTRYQGEEGLLFGLSYSLDGIVEEKLCPAFYDCSWHSLDLYYNYRIFQYMRRRGLLSKVKIALLAFPYYYFNFDMSRSIAIYRAGTQFALRGLDDWHNYRQVPEAYDYVTNYRMFGKKISEFYSPLKYKSYSRRIYQDKDGGADLFGSWLREHPETVAENKTWFVNFYRELSEMDIVPFWVIPPVYIKGISRSSLESAGKRKQEFYQIMKTLNSGIRIYDFFDAFADRRELFSDVVHLNPDGAEAFTELINQTVLQEWSRTIEAGTGERSNGNFRGEKDHDSYICL